MNHTVLKKLISALLILGVLLGASACRKTPEVVETQPAVTAAPETSAPVETTEAATTPAENSGNYDSPQEQRTLLIVALLLVLGVCAVVVLIIINRKGKK